MKYVIKKYLFVILILLASSCSPIVENRGYVFDEKLLDQIKVNETISNDVMDILGSPSTTSGNRLFNMVLYIQQSRNSGFLPPYRNR